MLGLSRAAQGTLDPDAPIVGPLISEVLIETPLGPMKLAAMSMESLSVAPGGKVNISGGPVAWPRLEVLLVGTSGVQGELRILQLFTGIPVKSS